MFFSLCLENSAFLRLIGDWNVYHMHEINFYMFSITISKSSNKSEDILLHKLVKKSKLETQHDDSL